MVFHVTHQNVLLSIPCEEEEKRESRAGSIDSPPSSPYCISAELVKVVEGGERENINPFKVWKLQLQEVIQDFALRQQFMYASLLFLINDH